MAKPEMSWFRAYAEMVDDEKLRLLAFEDRWHFVALLCCKRSGLLDNGDPHELLCRKVAVKLGLQLRELEAMSARLGEVGLIDPITFQPLAWADRQFESDTSTTRVREYRERKRKANAERYGETSMQRSSNVSETAQETETETETEKEIKAKQPPAKKPPAAREPIPDPPEWVDREAWDGFAEMRKRKRAPLTARAAKLIFSELEKLRTKGHDPTAVLDQSTRNTWTDVYPIRQPQSHEDSSQGRKRSVVERIEANILERRHRETTICASGAPLPARTG